MNPKTFSHPELIKKLPQEVVKLFEIFGVEIRLVGGSVRDLLLQKKVSDFDFATKFTPQEITEILNKNKIKAVPTGVKFGTITAVVAGKNFEITTLRKDEKTDGRHCEPEFVSDYFLDASRRDFTINALYLDSKGLLHDYFGGVSDLQNQKVRFIGDANKRIEEDFLRILRFFRFSCEYASGIDAEGLKACVEQKKNLKQLSRERVRAEILKMLVSSKKENLLAILRAFKDQKIAPELFAQEIDIAGLNRLFKFEEEFEFVASLGLKIATLFLSKGSDSKGFCQEICATNLEKKYFSHLLREVDFSDLKQILAFNDRELVLDSYLFFLIKNSFEKNAEVRKNIHFLQNFSLPNFPLSGEDVMQLGLSNQEVGKAINSAKKFWAKNDFNAQKIDLIKFLQNDYLS